MRSSNFLHSIKGRWLILTILLAGLTLSFYSFTPAHVYKPNAPIAELAISHGHCNLTADAIVGNVEFDWERADKSDITIDFEVDMSTVKTFSEKYDAHLKSPQNFNTGKYQNVVFDCKDNFKLGKNWYQLRGDLTINGVTKDVRLMMKSSKYYKKSTGQRSDKYIISGDVDLFDYNIYYKEIDGKSLSHETIMYFNIELFKDLNCQINF